MNNAASIQSSDKDKIELRASGKPSTCPINPACNTSKCARSRKTSAPKNSGRIIALQGGETCADAAEIPSLPYSVDGTTVGYADNYDEACPYAGSTSPDVVYYYTPQEDINITILTCVRDTDYDNKLYIYDGDCQEPDDGREAYACNDDCGPYNGFYVACIHDLPVYAGHTYYIVMDGYGGQFGNYSMDIFELIIDGACCLDMECVGTMEEVECLALGGGWIENEDCDAGFDCESAYPCGHYIVGDYNSNGFFNTADIIAAFSKLSIGSPDAFLLCECPPESGNVWAVAIDVNNSCAFNVTDVIVAFSYLQTGSPGLVPCHDCPPGP